MWKIMFFMLPVVFLSCEHISITDNEIKGVENVLKIYGGECDPFKRVYFTARKGYFKLTVSNSKVINTLSQIPELPASNIAYIFYKSLKEEERLKFEDIKVELHLSNGAIHSYKYLLSDLSRIAQKESFINKIVQILREKNFDLLRPMMVKQNNDAFIRGIAKVETLSGTILDFSIIGFKMLENGMGNQIVHVSGLIYRQQENTHLSLDIELDSNKEEIVNFQYSL